jgi:hypothetical protein
MTIPEVTPPDVDSACRLLRQFSCLIQQPDSTQQLGSTQHPSTIDRTSLQQALQRVAESSDYQILGICADSLAEGVRALEGYTAALGYAPKADLAAIDGAVYIKFNPKSGLCYADTYSGNHRGVLVSCQSAEETDVNEMFGHLPLDLFDR